MTKSTQVSPDIAIKALRALAREEKFNWKHEGHQLKKIQSHEYLFELWCTYKTKAGCDLDHTINIIQDFAHRAGYHLILKRTGEFKWIPAPQGVGLDWFSRRYDIYAEKIEWISVANFSADMEWEIKNTTKHIRKKYPHARLEVNEETSKLQLKVRHFEEQAAFKMVTDLIRLVKQHGFWRMKNIEPGDKVTVSLSSWEGHECIVVSVTETKAVLDWVYRTKRKDGKISERKGQDRTRTKNLVLIEKADGTPVSEKVEPATNEDV